MLAKVGTFSKATGAATATQSITGVGFQPKLVILFGTRLTAAGWNNSATLHHIGMGASDGTREWARSATFEDNDTGVGITPSCAHTDAKAFRLVDTAATPATIAECDLTITADGFDLAWTTNNSEAWQIGYLCIGGVNVSARAGTFDTPGATGNQAITGVGFQPKLLLLSGTLQSTAAATQTRGANFSFGAFDGTNQACISGGALTGGNTNARKGQNVTAVYQSHTLTDPTVLRIVADAVSLDADGFTNNFSVADGTSELGYICLGGTGFSAKVLADSAKLTTGTQATTGVGFTPRSLLMFSWGRTASVSLSNDPAWSFGLTDGQSHHVSATMDISTSPTKTSSNHSVTKALAVSWTGDDTATSVEADYSAFGPDGYTLDYTKVTGAAESFITIAMGGAEAGGKGSGGKGKGGNTPGPGEPPKKPLRTSLAKSWKWQRSWR